MPLAKSVPPLEVSFPKCETRLKEWMIHCSLIAFSLVGWVVLKGNWVIHIDYVFILIYVREKNPCTFTQILWFGMMLSGWI